MADNGPLKKKGGRPRHKPETRYTAFVAFKLTEAEADALYRYAIKSRMPVSEYIRQLLRKVTKGFQFN